MIQYCGVYGISGKQIAQVNESSLVKIMLENGTTLYVSDDKIGVKTDGKLLKTIENH